MDWGLVVSIIGLSATLFAGVFAFGKLASRLDALENRVKEDREHNEKQHTEFYVVKDDNIRMSAKMDAMIGQLDKIEKALEDIASRIPAKRRTGE
jgi:hypothetical protein